MVIYKKMLQTFRKLLGISETEYFVLSKLFIDNLLNSFLRCARAGAARRTLPQPRARGAGPRCSAAKWVGTGASARGCRPRLSAGAENRRRTLSTSRLFKEPCRRLISLIPSAGCAAKEIPPRAAANSAVRSKSRYEMPVCTVSSAASMT